MPLALQTPVDSPFGARSTAMEVVRGHDLSGKRALVTGGYSGIGLETTRALAAAGAEVIVPARDREKAGRALAQVEGRIEIADLDLCDQNSVRACADSLAGRFDSLHLLIGNAGIMACPLQRTAEGWELQFATNHLGHFTLFAGLLPLLRRADGARVVALSSLGHLITDVDREDPMFHHRAYDKWVAYGQSKSANAQFAVAVAQRFSGDGIRAYSVHPGGIMTDLQRDLAVEEMRAMGWIDEQGRVPDRFKTPEQGAATSVWAAVSPLLGDRSGAYLEDCNVAVEEEGRTQSGQRAWAVDPDRAEALWVLSERLTGLRV